MATSQKIESDTGYQPINRRDQSHVMVGNHLYMWGGVQSKIGDKELSASCVDAFDLNSGEWTQKQTTGNPPLGIKGHSSVAVNNEIFYYGGDRPFGGYYNSLHSLNVLTLHWTEHSPDTTADGHPSKKFHCGMVYVQLEGDDYLAVIGGYYYDIIKQLGAEYHGRCTNEIHFYGISSGQWVSPAVNGNIPPPLSDFTLTSITNDKAILFGGQSSYEYSKKLYSVTFSKTSVNWKLLSSAQSSVNWPKKRCNHCSVFINTPVGPHLLVVGGHHTYDCWLLDIDKIIWTELTDVPDTFTNRWSHSLSVWPVTKNTSLILEFGGGTSFCDFAIIDLTYDNDKNKFFVSPVPLDKYQQNLKEIWRKWALSLDTTCLRDKKINYQHQQQAHRMETLSRQLEAAVTLYHEAQQDKAVLVEQKKELDEENQELRLKLKEERILTAKFKKQLGRMLTTSDYEEKEENEELEVEKEETVFTSEKEKEEESLKNKINDEKMTEKKPGGDVDASHKIDRLHDQGNSHLKEVKEVGLQFDYLVPQLDVLQDSHVHVAGQNLFLLQGDSPHSFNWEQYGFRLYSPQGILQSNTDTCEVAVTSLVSGPFNLPKGTVLVSAIYAISVSKPLLKPLDIELEHCVDLRTPGQTDCLKFMRASLQSNPPYQLEVVEGGVFSVGSRYGIISRRGFCGIGIGAKLNELGDGEGEENDSSSDEGGDPISSGSSDEETGQSEVGGEGASNNIQSEETTSSIEQETTDQCNGTATEEVPSDLHVYSNDTQDRTTDGNKAVPSEVSHTDILYTGMMYHEQRGTGYWKTTYTVVRDLEVLKTYLRKRYKYIEEEDIDVFKFAEPKGILCLSFKADSQLQTGWKVHPSKEPMELCQSTVLKFTKNPAYSSRSYSIYACTSEPGAATEPLHCPIQLTGIEPSFTIYIDRPLPTVSQTVTGPTTDIFSSRQQVTSGECFRADIAQQVICSNFELIKKSRIRLYSLANKLLKNRVINEGEKNEVTDERNGLTVDERMDKLLGFVTACIQEDGDDFKLFLDILRQENTRRADRLADKLLEQYRNM